MDTWTETGLPLRMTPLAVLHKYFLTFFLTLIQSYRACDWEAFSW
jgi:hypothetical protein